MERIEQISADKHTDAFDPLRSAQIPPIRVQSFPVVKKEATLNYPVGAGGTDKTLHACAVGLIDKIGVQLVSANGFIYHLSIGNPE